MLEDYIMRSFKIYILHQISTQKSIRWARHVTCWWNIRNAYKIFVLKPELRQITWEDNIKMDFKEMWFEDVNWSQEVQDNAQWRVIVNTVTDLLIP
jgi:hypothetical protein